MLAVMERYKITLFHSEAIDMLINLVDQVADSTIYLKSLITTLVSLDTNSSGNQTRDFTYKDGFVSLRINLDDL